MEQEIIYFVKLKRIVTVIRPSGSAPWRIDELAILQGEPVEA
jgi:hypothetical protein